MLSAIHGPDTVLRFLHILFGFDGDLMKFELLLFSLFELKKWGSERESNFAKDVQLTTKDSSTE